MTPIINRIIIFYFSITKYPISLFILTMLILTAICGYLVLKRTSLKFKKLILCTLIIISSVFTTFISLTMTTVKHNTFTADITYVKTSNLAKTALKPKTKIYTTTYHDVKISKLDHQSHEIFFTQNHQSKILPLPTIARYHHTNHQSSYIKTKTCQTTLQTRNKTLTSNFLVKGAPTTDKLILTVDLYLNTKDYQHFHNGHHHQ